MFSDLFLAEMQETPDLIAEFSQRAVSIHVYSKPFDTCEIYQREKGTYADVPLHYTSEYGKLNPAEKLL